MTLSSYLGQLQYADLKFKKLMDSIDEWHNIAIGLGMNTDNGDRVQTSKRPDKMENAVIKAVEYEEEARKEYGKYVELKKTIETQLNSLSKTEYGLILDYAYIQGLTDGEVSAILSLQERTLKRHKQLACKEFEEKYGKCYL